jgi:hypothetical protein
MPSKPNLLKVKTAKLDAGTLWQPVRRPKRSRHVLPKPYDNLVRKGATATEIKTLGDAKGWEKVLTNRRLKSLEVAYLSQEKAEQLGALKSLEKLIIRNGGVTNLSSLGELGKLTELTIESAGSLRDFSFLGDLKVIRSLRLAGMNRFKDVSVLEALPRLRRFELVSTDYWSRLPTLKSFGGLKQLRELFVGYPTGDDSLEPLAALTGLKVLGLGLQYPLKEFARLAVALPDVRCALFSEPYSIGMSSFRGCKCCGGNTSIALAKGYRAVCPECDSDKFVAYMKQFEDLKAGFTSKVARTRVRRVKTSR